MPAESLIRCRPAHRELRPAGSFWDCLGYLLLGWGAAGPFRVVEPPQTLERTGLPEPLDPWPDIRELFAREPVPEVATVDGSQMRCGVPRVRSPRFAMTSACPTHETEFAATPIDAPVPPEFKGKGLPWSWPCKCECECPGRTTEETTFPLVRDAEDALVEWTVPPPLFPPPSRPRDDRPAIVIAPSGPDVPERPPPIPDLPIIVAGDARPENVFSSLCPWCGQIRPRRSTTAPTVTTARTHRTRPAEVEPPQSPARVSAPRAPEITTLSHGTVSAPQHPTADEGIRSAHAGAGISPAWERFS